MAEYTYNDAGIRVSAYRYQLQQGTPNIQSESTTLYLVDENNPTGYAQTLEEWTETSATAATLITYTLGDDIIAQGKSHWTKTGDAWAINTTGGVEATQYLLYDGHGSTRNLAEYDATSGATITAAYAYDGYGVRLGNQAEPSTDTSLLYTGEHYDTDASQYYLRARWYDPSNGRFNLMDPFEGNSQDPQSLHKYLYCHANPVNGIDPSGEFTLCELMVNLTTNLILNSILSNVIYPAVGDAFRAIVPEWAYNALENLAPNAILLGISGSATAGYIIGGGLYGSVEAVWSPYTLKGAIYKSWGIDLPPLFGPV